MKRFLATLIALGFGMPLVAQSVHQPIIPNLIAHDNASARVSVRVERGLTNSNSLRAPALQRARVALHNGGTVSAEHMRALASAGDGLAAQRYVRLLKATNVQANPSDLAYYSAIAVGTGRVWTLGTMIDAMHQLDPGTEPQDRIRKYISVLYPHAWAGNSLALQAVVAFNGEGRLFGPLSERTRERILTEARALGDGRIELGMAVGLLERTRAAEVPDPSELAQARSLLERAEVSTHLAVRTSAQNFLRLMDQKQMDDG